jgi:hypothetical protein
MGNEHLKRQCTTTGDRSVWTWAGWVKNQNHKATSGIFGGYYSNNDSNFIELLWTSGGNNLTFQGSSTVYFSTEEGYLDNGGWLHIVVSVNTHEPVGRDRCKLYINGFQNNYFSSQNDMTHYGETPMSGRARQMYIGARASDSDYSKMLVTDCFFVDDVSLGPETFGYFKREKGGTQYGDNQFDSQYTEGLWSAKKPSVIIKDINEKGGFGPNGYYLPLNDHRNPGADHHMVPDTIFKMNTELAQPKVGIATTSTANAFTDVLKLDDPFSANQYLKYALPGVRDGAASGFGDYSNLIVGSGTSVAITNNGASISDEHSFYGSAMFFDGSNDYVDSGALAADETFCVEAWLKVSSQAAGERPINLGNVHNNNTGYLYIELTGSNSFKVRQQSLGILGDGIGRYDLGQWVHVAYTHDNTLQVTKFYVNGTCVKSAHGNTWTANSTMVVRLGADQSNASAGLYHGYIQDARVYFGTTKYTEDFDVPHPYRPVGIESFRTSPHTPVNDYPCFNWMNNYSTSVSFGSAGNSAVTSTAHLTVATDTVLPKTGKWYWEYKASTIVAQPMGGIANQSLNENNLSTYCALYRTSGELIYSSDSDGSPGSTSSWGATYGTSDVIGVAYDADNRNLYFSKNGTFQNSGDPTSGSTGTGAISISAANYGYDLVPIVRSSSSSTEGFKINFGQDPSFDDNEDVTTTYLDANGNGRFHSAVPTGYLALCTQNLPEPAIEDPRDHFLTKTYEGGAYDEQPVKVGFRPDLVWIKNRSGQHSWSWCDSATHGKYLKTNSTDGDAFSDSVFRGMGQLGFNIGSASRVNETNANISAYCWKAGGPTYATNNDGSTTSYVSANTTAGFSIIKYTGNGTAGATVGHGLNSAPEMIICKLCDGNGFNWIVWHRDIGTGKYLELNTSEAYQNQSSYNMFNSTAPTDSVITLGSIANTNNNTNAFRIWAWHSVEGYSRIGSYTGNGVHDEGPYINTGFRPVWLMVKKYTSGNEDWAIIDAAKNPNTAHSQTIVWGNLDSAEQNNGINRLRFTSTGFKIYSTSGDPRWNSDGEKYIYMAFAEQPVKYKVGH